VAKRFGFYDKGRIGVGMAGALSYGISGVFLCLVMVGEWKHNKAFDFISSNKLSVMASHPSVSYGEHEAVFGLGNLITNPGMIARNKGVNGSANTRLSRHLLP